MFRSKKLIVIHLSVIFVFAGTFSLLVSQIVSLKNQLNTQQLKNTSKPTPTPVYIRTEPDEKAIEINLEHKNEKVDFLKRYSDVVVFTATNNTTEENEAYREYSSRIYVSDTDISKKSTEEIYKLENSEASPLESIKRLSGKHREYFVVQISGIALDLIIFTKDGELIAKSVRNSNELIKNWNISFEKYDNNTQTVWVKLFEMGGSEARAQIDPETGKVVEGTFEKLPATTD